MERAPTISIVTEDLDALNSFATGYASISSSLAAYFRKRDDGGEFVADGTGEHVSFSFAAGMITVSVDAGSIETGQGTITFTGKALTASTTATIP